MCLHHLCVVYLSLTDYGEGLWVNLPAVDESFESKSACKDVLKRELEMCSELLQLEPDNKCECIVCCRPRQFVPKSRTLSCWI